MSECEQEAKDKSASDTPRVSLAETMTELRIQPSFTYNDDDSNSDGPAARFVMLPTEINDSFAAKFQRSLFTASVVPYHRSLRSAGTTDWRKSHLTFHRYNTKCEVTFAPSSTLRSYYILPFTLRSSVT
jgi:hypothetical protein